jgi:hypothetical protein
MVSRRTVLSLVERGLDYREVAARLGIGPGLAYLIATGTSVTNGETHDRPENLPAAGQDLTFPPAHNPTRRPEVWTWVANRARADWQMSAASKADKSAE